MEQEVNRFMSWRDIVITPLVFGGILATAAILSWRLAPSIETSLFAYFLTFYFFVVGLTLAVLKVLRVLFPMKAGTYTYATHPRECFIWNLYGFLCITNLNIFYDKILLPIPFRKGFFQLMGASIGSGIVPISGLILDPHLVTIGANSHLGEDSMLTPHAVTSNNKLYIGEIVLGKGVMIGAKSTLMPGVIVGDGAMVNAMSLVTMNTKIPALEIWGGIPARKLGDVGA